ncbi:Predicted nucleic acid-binding protein, contains PIN domain [Geodermatophilus dictyosporus]|uniref:Ribonuclease VapC n=1 Tax=Geodermatophilus dictyosporus TaxID=1523247 RepID=A0A1I5TS06_9ACTN|nr:type II toxin-antitoxin system VapC family toxin [Geodermatophilus dictyosporus]SFP85825.1 Predicted nucleic acid-binding protein, contains PIN domain [Geodermatophilus dictyosporus]
MRVLDASVVIDAMAVSGPAGDRARRLVAGEAWLHVPSVVGAEITSALRGMVLRGVLTTGDARVAAVRASRLRARRYPFEPFLARVWDLRDNVTVYDAWYVALAESLGAPLVTADDRLRRADGPRCEVLSPEEVLASAEQRARGPAQPST